MELKEAIDTLIKHQEWRRYDGPVLDSPEMTNPTKLGIAIDTVIDYLTPVKDI